MVAQSVRFVVDFDVKSAYNLKTNLFTKNTKKSQFKIKKKRSGYITGYFLLLLFFFFCDAIMSFNEMLALQRKENEYEMELLLKLSNLFKFHQTESIIYLLNEIHAHLKQTCLVYTIIIASKSFLG